MLKFLLHVNKGVELRKRLEEIDLSVETDYDGGRIFKDIHILVQQSGFKANVVQTIVFQRITGTELDADGSTLIKFVNELPAKSASPFILAVEVHRQIAMFNLTVGYLQCQT